MPLTSIQQRLGAEILHFEIARRMRGLRTGLGLIQGEFAKRIGVSKSQVFAWESGTKGCPSAAKLLEIAKLAIRMEDRHWFIQKAGVDLDALKADFREEASMRIRSIEPNLVAKIPVVNAFQLDPDGVISPRMIDLEEFHVSSQFVGHPGSTVGVFLYPELAARCSSLPYPAGEGGLLIVDRTQVRLSDFLESSGASPPRLAAVLLPDLPDRVEAGRESTRRETAELDKLLFDAVEEWADHDGSVEAGCADGGYCAPVILFGTLVEQFAGANVSEIAPSKGLSRIFLSTGPAEGLALTDWQEAAGPRTGDVQPFLNGASIYGAVVGWLKAPREQRSSQ